AALLAHLYAYLTATGTKLVTAMDAPAERAHAALLLALSFELTGMQQTPEKAAAWDQARRLQEESVRNGAPGTQPRLFNYLERRFGREKQ
ncbi:MAG: hypothetical protein NTW87_31510, partial [Planctomycetota bacterium]|nr:hypothetical protein [Planctomycetota bacterium]